MVCTNSEKLVCRGCGSSSFSEVLDLGSLPLANTFPEIQSSLPKHPLELVVCEACGLAQLSINPDLSELYDDYIWVTASSSLIHNELAEILEWLPLKEESKVIEVASNDGTFLKILIEAGFVAHGVEPALNLAQACWSDGLSVDNCLFDSSYAEYFESNDTMSKFDCLVARNVFAHVPSIAEFLETANTVLADDGIIYLEFHDGDRIIEDLQFDSIYHEHQSYITFPVIEGILRRAGWTIVRKRYGPIGGGSLGLVAKRFNGSDYPSVEIDLLVRSEIERWKRFAHQVSEYRDELRQMLLSLKSEGKKIAAYGTSARSSTLANFCGIEEFIDIAVDGSIHKHGRYWTGTALKVESPGRGFNDIDAVLVTAWNFFDEIRSSLREVGFDGLFIKPLPNKPRLITGATNERP